MNLTPRERDLIRGVLDAKPNKIIAHELGIKPDTVTFYFSRLFAKTGALNRVELGNMFREAFQVQKAPISFQSLRLLAEDVSLTDSQCREMLVTLLQPKDGG
jgi:DNA-binding CsgD family transcriptional regulator